VPLPVSQFRVIKDVNILTRQHTFAPFLETPMYEPVYVLPVHFGIGDEMFHALLGAITRR
jgi:hypothetical protein